MTPTPFLRTSLAATAASVLAALVTIVVTPAPAYAAGGPLRAVPLQVTLPALDADDELIPDTYIVTMRSDIDPANAIQSLRLSDHQRFEGGLNGFTAKLNPGQLKALSRNADVMMIEQDAWHHNVLDTTQNNPPSWGIDRIDQVNRPLSNSYTYTATGSGVHAYIIDTGVAPGHSNFGGRASFDFNSIDSNNTDCNNHGTHVAGTIGSTSYGVAKQVRLHGVKWLNCAGSGTTTAAINAINWVRTNHVKPAVANTSWNASYSATLETAIVNMINAGVFLATSAGNTGGNSCDRLPRRVTAALVVAATTNTDARASYSSIGACVDIYAPGSAIVSTVPSGGTASMSGTSMATPHAAGIAALYKSSLGDASQATVHNWIVSNASLNVVTGSLSGTPNRLVNKRNL